MLEKFNKIQHGLSKGSFVILQQGKETDPIFMAEVISIREAGVMGKIVASMGVHNISEKKLILCTDNGEHKVNSQTQKIFEKSKKRLTLTITLVLPLQLIHPGYDFNDSEERGWEKHSELCKRLH